MGIILGVVMAVIQAWKTEIAHKNRKDASQEINILISKEVTENETVLEPNRPRLRLQL